MAPPTDLIEAAALEQLRELPACKLLSDKELRFVTGYLESGVKRLAAQAAGYAQSAASAVVTAARLLNEPRIALALGELSALRRAERALLVDQLIHSLIDDAFFDPSEAFDSQGDPLSVPDMPLHVRQRLKSAKVGQWGTTLEFIDRQRAKEQLLGILGVGNEKAGLTININVGDSPTEQGEQKRVGQLGLNI